jgi:hypothetical protein
VLSEPGMLWGRAMSLSTVSHTQMHSFLTQTSMLEYQGSGRTMSRSHFTVAIGQQLPLAEGERSHLHFSYEDTQNHGLIIQAQNF